MFWGVYSLFMDKNYFLAYKATKPSIDRWLGC